MTLPREGRALRALVVLPLLAVPVLAHASGFALESQGARASGFSGAFVAQAADPSAIHYNAAGIGFLKGKQLYLGGTFGSLATDFAGNGPNPPAGTLETSSSGLGVLPSFYYSQQIRGRAVLGVGFGAPFGFRSQWDNPDQFTGRYICLDCRVRAWSLNPTLAYRIEDRLSVGFGLDVRFSKFSQTRRLLANPNPFPVPTDVAELTFESRTTAGLGWNVGLLASPSETVSVGVAYRHKVAIVHDATAGFAQILTGDTAIDEAVALGLPKNQVATASFRYPASLAAGIAVKHRYWTVEGDLQWTYWSSFDAVRLAFPSTPGYDTALAQDYESTWRGALGLEYLVGERWEVRGGYSYDHSPQPTPTLSPFLHDEDRHGFTLGGSYKYGQLRLDAFARLLLFRERTTLDLSRYDYDGVYRSSGFSAGVSLGYRF
jgi:long-chain fatty acid transport protein